MEKPIDVMMIGIETEASRTRDEQIIKRAGGDNVRVTKINFIDHAVSQHRVGRDSYELIIFMKKKKNEGLEVIKKLKDKVNVSSMIVGVVASVTRHKEISDAWKEAGAHKCLVEPLTEEKMITVFNDLKVGIEAGIFKKMFKVLIVDDGSYHIDLEQLIKQEGGLVATSFNNGDCARAAYRAGVSYDIVLVSKASMVPELRGMWPNSTMVGLASSEAEHQALTTALGLSYMEPIARSNIRVLMSMISENN